MKYVLSAVFAAGCLMAAVSPAPALTLHAHDSYYSDIRDGCGRGHHRNRHDRCVRDRDDDRGGYHRDSYRDRDSCGRHRHWSRRRGRCVHD